MILNDCAMFDAFIGYLRLFFFLLAWNGGTSISVSATLRWNDDFYYMEMKPVVKIHRK